MWLDVGMKKQAIKVVRFVGRTLACKLPLAVVLLAKFCYLKILSIKSYGLNC